MSAFYCTSIYLKQRIPFWHGNRPSFWSPHGSGQERGVVLGGISLTALEKISIRKIIFTARKVRLCVQQDMHARTHRFPGVK